MGRPINVRQRTPEWIAARRTLITATDIAAIIGVSPWKSEADVAADKQGAERDAETFAMQIGSAVEPVILGGLERVTDRPWQRMHGLWRHSEIEWAAASPDARTRTGARRLGELKWSMSRSRWADGLPEDVEAQVRWQLGVLGWEEATVAALVGDELKTFDVEHDEATWIGMVAIAEDFRRRLAAGGPFRHSLDSAKRMWPADNGAEMTADGELVAAVRSLVALRGQRRAMEAEENALEASIKARMGEVATLRGPDFTCTWKRSKDTAATDWKAVAEAAMTHLPETERKALVGAWTTVRPGFRPFRVTTRED